MSSKDKPLEWVGRAYQELLDFPSEARNRAGHDLRQVQKGRQPEDWKVLEGVGPGACEIRVRTYEGGTVQHRVVYVAKFAEAVYVLHAFQKKTQATSQHNLDVARTRYAQMLRNRQDRDKPRRGGPR
jgi:phage-related protein